MALVDITSNDIARMEHILSNSDAVAVYADYLEVTPNGFIEKPCINYQLGSIRDDFNFGPIMMVKTSHLRVALSMASNDYTYAAWYDLRLALSRLGNIVHIPEALTSFSPTYNNNTNIEQHFNYVNPRNRDAQLEMEQACTSHLKAIKAWLSEREHKVDFGQNFPVEVSVIIPVKNRVRTIIDAITSALNQETDFEYNIIVVDNHSSDGTTEAIDSLNNDKIIHIIPDSTALGIGGCWNLAINNPQCGRFAVQLDSDDLYSSPSTLANIVNCFHEQNCAMVVGTYSLVDFNMKSIPPGIIDHREWTNENGHNNLLRVNGLGAPRAFSTEVARQYPFPNVSYGEDYVMGLQISRSYRIGRIFDVLYLCRRWEGNSDSSLSINKANRYNTYKDTIRSWEINIRRNINIRQ